MLILYGQSRSAEVESVQGETLLVHAQRADLDWLMNCTKGTCARCRCIVEEGMDELEEVTDAEWERLDDDELDEGYRLACQAVVSGTGTVIARNKTYFSR